MSSIQQRSVGEYPGVYGVVKSFNDRPRGSTLRAYRGGGEEKSSEREEREQESERRHDVGDREQSRSLPNVALMLP